MEEAVKIWFKEDFNDFDSEEGLDSANPLELKRVNVLVGANNSGKSRFMRSLAMHIQSKRVNIFPPSMFLQNLNELNDNFLSLTSVDLNLKQMDTTDFSIISKLINEASGKVDRYLHLHNDYFANQNTLYSNADVWLKSIYSITKGDISTTTSLFHEVLEKLSTLELKAVYFNITEFEIHYINSLRTLKDLGYTNFDDKYINELISQDKGIDTEYHLSVEEAQNFLKNSPLTLRVAYDYRFSPSEIISGEGFFETLTDLLLGLPDGREQVKSYQHKLSHYFFNNEEVVIIPNKKSKSIEIKIGNSEQYPISDLGDGLQQIIILTYTSYVMRRPSIFLIEEPEMHLHAGYVKQLMKFLLNETDHYYMATSHSNYLLDMINEDKRIALYRVDKENVNNEEKKYETVIRRCDGDRTILQTLGVSPSSVFLANCTIWIEGITDRLYFVQYLKKYLDELKVTDEEKLEDYSRFIDGYHYAFVEYQGSNLEHWDFEIDNSEKVDSSKPKGLNAVLVTSNALVIADADLKDKPRFNELEQQLGERIIITQGKETENSIPKKLLVRKFFEMCPDNGLARQGNKKKLAYSDNYEKYFTDSYQTSSKGIGKYFDNILSKMRKDGVVPKLGNNEKSFTFLDGNQGTIKSKTNFCQDIVELMQSERWELTPSATELCESIFQHIKDNNH
ncbi:ATP-dependent nuclease [Psychrobacter sp. TWP2-1-2]|uniref:ATP-dependent nuclease n=1 Tax=Psychrobacter sp. TWP2-1-2 TaxID=2804623 RepID=UPI003CEAFA57